MEFTEEFFNEIQKRYKELPEEQKVVIREFLHNSEASQIFRGVFGPQYDEVVRMVHKPEKTTTGLGAPV